MMAYYQHFPVIAVMGCFLCAFLVEIFGSHNKVIRNILSIGMAGVALALMILLVKPVMIDGEIISYWLGNWEPVNGIAIGIGFEVDALGLVFALISTVTVFLSGIYSIRYLDHDKNKGHYYTLYLLLAGAAIGITLTGDIFNMFVMEEIVCFSGAALIAFRNHEEGVLEGAFKYFLIDSIGSKFILAGIACLYAQTHTLNMAQLASILPGNLTPLSTFALALMFAGFATKAFMIPFHTPVADGHTVAPASVHMILSGMVMKMGVYGMIRLLYILFRVGDMPSVEVLLTAFGSVTMFVGATMALQQRQFKRLLAFSSISQIGYVMAAAGLGTMLGMSGALYHAFNHTLFKGILFLCAGTVIHATGTGNLEELGGLSKRMPKTTIGFLVGVLSIAGIPPLNGFVSKWMIYQAAYEKGIATGDFYYIFVCIVAVVTSTITLAYYMKLSHAVFFGELPEHCKDATDPPFLMRLPIWIMAALCVLTGIFYKQLQEIVFLPASRAAFNITGYINAMMGAGYAEQAGVTDITAAEPVFGVWEPMTWLVLFVILFGAALVFMIIGGSSKEKAPAPSSDIDGRYAVFFSGEKSEYSHARSMDLFWGFRHSLKHYFGFITGAHTGNVNDYSLWAVAGSAIIMIFMFLFILR